MGLFAIALVLAQPAPARCGGAGMVRDRGLHRAWRVQPNCGHPEQPAVLVEVPWTEEVRVRTARDETTGSAASANVSVRAGMRVTLRRRDEHAAVQLVGTALEEARVGERIAVQVELSGRIVHGIVRGPGLVELAPAKGGN